MSSSETANILYLQASRASIAARIRQLRKARGWTLQDVEKRSHGLIKAVVIGSYERGDRSMNIERAIQIADLFGLPLEQLLTASASQQKSGNTSVSGLTEPDSAPSSVVIDLRKAKNTHFEETDATQFTLFLAWIVGLRQDWNGEILSLRSSDTDILALLMFKRPGEIIPWLEKYHLLISR